jgi:hypothetical protein
MSPTPKVFVTPVCDGCLPVNMADRLGVHMLVQVNALVKVNPFVFNRCMLGRLFFSQPGGKCWI